MNQDKYAPLKLENQLCFPLYAAARAVVRQYTPYLGELGLTYTQYIALMVLWEAGKCSVKELGKKLHLDSGTLTPLLKGMEKNGLILRSRSAEDERSVILELTEAGWALRERALSVPGRVAACVPLDQSEAVTLYRLLYKLLDEVGEKEGGQE